MSEARPVLAGALIDRATQRWVMATGRAVSIREGSWLDGPVGAPHGIGDGWIAEHAGRVGATLVDEGATGVLPDLDVLEGPGFDPAMVRPEVRSFYEHTADREMQLWTRWARWAEPGGRLINALFARRLRQLSLPLDPLEVALGMDSRLIALRSAEGGHLGTAWQRTLRSSGATVFGGFYGVTDVPEAARPSIRVVFPLPNGSISVYLRPENGPDGSLYLSSPRGGSGQEGAYLVVRPGAAERAWVRRVPLPETFHVFVDDADVLRCDHQLCFGNAEILRLHYRLERRGPSE